VFSVNDFSDPVREVDVVRHGRESLAARAVVPVLDAAHLLGPDQLEELRLLTNADMDSHSPSHDMRVIFTSRIGHERFRP
jgi:type II secretory pathway predicted ATPase ExeA